MKPSVVITHRNCADGFCAAWIAWQRFGDIPDYVQAQHHDLPPKYEGRDIYIFDFSYDRETTKHMVKDAHSFVLRDHHKTNVEELKDLHGGDIKFDMTKSGAMLTWDYFNPGKEAPWLVQYVQDRDLWRWELPNSKAVSAFIRTVPFDFHAWEQLSKLQLEDVILGGQSILHFVDALIRETLPSARRIKFRGFDIPCINIHPTLGYSSDITNRLAVGEPFAMSWFQREDGRYQYSLRCADPRGIDVSEIAKSLGGGGHRQAAGFDLDSLIV